MVGINELSSFTSNNTPALSSVKTNSTSYLLAKPIATAEATLSALVLSKSPSGEKVIGDTTGIAPLSSRSERTSALTSSTSPTKPQSISFTGRRCDLTTAISQPDRPQAFTPRACKADTTRLFAKPAYAITAISSVAASVMRRPSCILTSTPNFSAK